MKGSNLSKGFFSKWKRNTSKLMLIICGVLMVTSTTVAQNKIDSLLNIANSINELNYTIPSWTLLKRAVKRATTLQDSASTTALQNSINTLQSKELPYSIVMCINGSPTSRLGFAWFTNEGTTGGKVEIVSGAVTDNNAFQTPLLTIEAQSANVYNLNYNSKGNKLLELADIPDNTKKSYTQHKALATGLTPNTLYSYRVGKEGAWSETGTFTTAKANKDPFSFIYSTDPQANTDEMFDISQRTTHAANAMYPDANFWLNCGDLVQSSDNNNSEWEYEQFFRTQQDIFLNKPFAPIEGNHDFSINRNFTHHFNTETNFFDYVNSTVPGSIYSFVYGDALFLAFSYEDYDVTGQLDSIAGWMRRQVAAHPDTKWRIAFYHKAMFTGSVSHQSDEDGRLVREKMSPVFDELKIDLALQGHDHIYEVIGPIRNKKLVERAVSDQTDVAYDERTNLTAKSGGIYNLKNGTLYFLNNSAGKKKYEPRSKADMSSSAVVELTGLPDYFSLFTDHFGQDGNPMFSNIAVSTDCIVVKTFEINASGDVKPFDDFKLVK
jgi:hypothetical protein